MRTETRRPWARPAGPTCGPRTWRAAAASTPSLFGWEAQEPSPEFGGYFMFARDGVPVAGAMGDMGDMRADDSWKIYLATDDIRRTVAEAEAAGGMVIGRRCRSPTWGSRR